MNVNFACHCDKWGVVHVQMPDCDKNYKGPAKPSAMSTDPTANALIDFINDLSIRVSRLEKKLDV